MITNELRVCLEYLGFQMTLGFFVFGFILGLLIGYLICRYFMIKEIKEKMEKKE